MSTEQTTTDTSQSAAIIPPVELKPAARDEMLADLVKLKALNKSYEEKIKADELLNLKKSQDWQKIAEMKEGEAKDALAKADKIQQSYISEKKFSAVKEHAVRLGIRKEALGDLEALSLDDVQVETTSMGRINIVGEASFAERLKTLKPHWFDSKPNTSVNMATPSIISSQGDVTVDMIMQAERDGKKSGDMTLYRELTNKYRTQPRR